MVAVGKLPGELSEEERARFHVAFKHAVGSRRAELYTIMCAEQGETTEGNEEQALHALERCTA
eukprot:7966423-Lingulodinium_polyedra.AAC.1